MSSIILLIFSIWDIKYHDGDTILCGITNYGPILVDCEWPGGSGKRYIFSGGIWFGTVDKDTAVSIGYNPISTTSEFVPGLVRQGTTAYYNPFVRVYIYPEDWPPPKDTFPMAPDTNLTFEDSWCCLNDNDSTYHDSGDTHPIGIECYQSGYVDTRCPNTIFIRYTIKNCVMDTIQNSYLGLLLDFDIGNCDDDGYELLHNQWFPSPKKPDSFFIDILPYGYDYDYYEPGWGKVGLVGVYILETPEDIGPTSSLAFPFGAEPETDRERYLSLKGIDFQTGDSIGFMEGPVGPADLRFLYASGPFALPPGATTHFAFATVFGYDTISLAWQAVQACSFYYQHVGVEEEPEVRIPSRKIRTISNGIVTIGDWERVDVFDITGRIIVSKRRPEPILNLRSLPTGIYFLRLKERTQLRSKKILIVH